MTKVFIITGGNFKNKGAQAMVFAVVQELKKYYPEANIWAFCNVAVSQKDMYNFNVLYLDSRTVKRLLLGKLKILTKPSAISNNETLVDTILKKADAIFDVSGFSLSSQLKINSSLNYLFRIALAKRYKIKLYLLPQSFGPLNYKGMFTNLVMFTMLYYYLKYPKMIYARECLGETSIRRFTRKNVRKSLDLVLLTEKPDEEIIFNKVSVKKIKIKNKAIAIVPNTKLIKWNKNNYIYQSYIFIINELLSHDFHIYLLRHSQEDIDFCLNIKGMFNSVSRLTVLGDDYNCIELNEIIARMEFVVVSRYHSLIHAYKAGVPAIVIGWANKYPEIMDIFEQREYYFDIRDKIDERNMVNALIKMINSIDINKECIKVHLQEITMSSKLDRIVSL